MHPGNKELLHNLNLYCQITGRRHELVCRLMYLNVGVVT